MMLEKDNELGMLNMMSVKGGRGVKKQHKPWKIVHDSL